MESNVSWFHFLPGSMGSGRRASLSCSSVRNPRCRFSYGAGSWVVREHCSAVCYVETTVLRIVCVCVIRALPYFRILNRPQLRILNYSHEPVYPYIPGRICVRFKAFRCRFKKAGAAAHRLLALTGVSQVHINPHAGSVTAHYDSALLKKSDLPAALEQSGCLGATRCSNEVSSKAGEMFGKALGSAVVQKAVEQSARPLVGVLI